VTAQPDDAVDGQRPSLRVAQDKPRTRWALPHPVVELLGRNEAVASAVQQLRDGVRLFSLVGTGGVGKTQLAIRIAHDAQQHYPQGACFVPLAESRPGELYPAIARAMGLKLPPHEEPKVTVWRALQHSRLLLVVDNFEHMLGEAAELALMLAHCAQLSLLVTSRMRLNLVAETCVAVPPLAVEHSGKEQPEALQMFIACARRVGPGSNGAAAMRMTPPSSPHAWAVCRWPSSWPRHACRCSAPATCAARSKRACRWLPAVAPTGRCASVRCNTLSVGAMRCCQRTSRRCCCCSRCAMRPLIIAMPGAWPAPG
jgi:AAA domain